MKSTGGYLALWAIALSIAACAAELSKKSGGSNQDGGTDDSPGMGSGSGGATPSGSGRDAAARNGGSSGSAGASGSGGIFGSGGSAAGAGGRPASADAGAVVNPSRDAAPPTASPCQVAITAIAPVKLLDLLEGTVLRLRATALGPQAPATPTWQWRITGEDSIAITPTAVSGQPAEIEISLAHPGVYRLRAQASAVCIGTETASVRRPDERQTTFWLRVLPPPANGAAMNVPVLETGIPIFAGRDASRDLMLSPGYPVTVDPVDTRGVAIASYVRISSQRSSVVHEGHTRGRGFRLALDPQLTYDVLLVPDSTPAAPVAPLFIAGVRPAQLGAMTLTMDVGLQVTGQILDGRGMPVPDVRVLMRQGVLTSTLAMTDTMGRYQLRARPGVHQIEVTPPDSSHLPTLILPTPGIGLTDTRARVDVGFAAVAAANIEIDVVNDQGSAPEGPLRVRVQSNDLPSAGTFSIDGDSTPGTGQMRAEQIGTGRLFRFESLPRARYQVTVTPVDPASALGITTAVMDLGGTAPRTSLKLLSKVKVSGSFEPAGQAATRPLIAFDTGTNPFPQPTTSRLDAQGRFDLWLNPNRQFRLWIEPSADGAFPRAPLFTEALGTAARVIAPRPLPRGITLSGRVLLVDTTNTALTGAVVQVYCMGPTSDCIDTTPGQPLVEPLRPLTESVSGPTGEYRVVLPDPATTNL